MTTPVAVAVFALATVVVVVVAPGMARVSDELTSRTRLGAALFGAVFLGASTSLPGIVVTVSAALAGQLGLAAGNALGGIGGRVAPESIIVLTGYVVVAAALAVA